MGELPRLRADASVADVVDALQREGCAVVERFIDHAKVAALRAELAPFREQTPTGRNDFEGFDTVPGSHTTGPSDLPSPDTAITATMPAGSVMFYSGTVWHGGGANRTSERRLGVILEYVASWLRAQENHVVAVSPEVMRTLPPRLQELLGYNIFPPFLGYVDGRHPRRALAVPTEATRH